MSRTDRSLVVIAAACVVGLVLSPLVLDLPSAWADLASTVLGTVVEGAILAVLVALAWRWWREAQEVRLLQAFLKKSGGKLKRRVSLKEAVADAKLQDPRPVVDRLLYKSQIGPWPKRWIEDIPQDEWEREKHKLTDKDQFVPDLFYLNHEGRARAEERRWWWPGGFWL